MRENFQGYDQTDLLRELVRSVATLQTQSEQATIDREKRRQADFQARMLSFMESTDKRLERLEAKAERPMVDWTAITKSLWAKLLLLALLLTGNQTVIDWAKLVLTR